MEKRSLIANQELPIQDNTGLERLKWLRRVRWAAFLGHGLVFICATFWLDLLLEPTPFLIVELILLISNLIFYHQLCNNASNNDWFLGLVVSFDVVLFTYLLANYGGHINPFSMFYLVHVVLAALLVSQLWSWLVTLISSACFSSLFLWQNQSDMHLMHHGSAGGFDMHLNGMLVAFILISILIATFVTRMRSSIDRQELELLRLRANADKLISLTTLAAGAAHELNTPLSTMSVILGDLYNSKGLTDINLKSDLSLLKQELDRCNGILRKLSPSSGELLGEMPTRFRLTELANDVESVLPKNVSDRLLTELNNGDSTVLLPKEAVLHLIMLLVKNAYEATENNIRTELTKIRLLIFIKDSMLHIEIRDSGVGIKKDILQRIGEPFFTTKEAGRGMGLGIFLCRMLVSRFGGELLFESICESEAKDKGIICGGTTVKIVIPSELDWRVAA